MQPTSSTLMFQLVLAGSWIVLISPRKLQTIGMMLKVFITTIFAFILWGALLTTFWREVEPETFGALSLLIGMGTADVFSLFHVRSLRRG